jgi:hypothetical protein
MDGVKSDVKKTSILSISSFGIRLQKGDVETYFTGKFVPGKGPVRE